MTCLVIDGGAWKLYYSFMSKFKPIFKTFSAICLSSLVLVGQPFVSSFKFESSERLNLIKKLQALPPAKEVTVAPQLPPLSLTPVSNGFSLVIEKIGVNVPVVEKTDLIDEKIYMEAMRHGAAHGKGTVLPGSPGISFIFGHSSNNYLPLGPYNSIFNRLNELEKDDRLSVFYKEVRYDYLVTEKVIVSPQDIGHIIEKTEEAILVVGACYPVGTTNSRILIKGKLVI
ncbi:MAG: sortase [Patescibacteria group bacterium]|nr:sortase [Patescibacteria group bacterium]